MGGSGSGEAAAATAAAAAATATAVPFVFVSAAEAKWDFRAPVDWLEDYLVAKRAVETKLSDMTTSGALRGCCLRPSLVYTFDRPQALPAVAAFVVGRAVSRALFTPRLLARFQGSTLRYDTKIRSAALNWC